MFHFAVAGIFSGRAVRIGLHRRVAALRVRAAVRCRMTGGVEAVRERIICKKRRNEKISVDRSVAVAVPSPGSRCAESVAEQRRPGCRMAAPGAGRGDRRESHARGGLRCLGLGRRGRPGGGLHVVRRGGDRIRPQLRRQCLQGGQEQVRPQFLVQGRVRYERPARRCAPLDLLRGREPRGRGLFQRRAAGVARRVYGSRHVRGHAPAAAGCCAQRAGRAGARADEPDRQPCQPDLYFQCGLDALRPRAAGRHHRRRVFHHVGRRVARRPVGAYQGAFARAGRRLADHRTEEPLAAGENRGREGRHPPGRHHLREAI